MSDDKYESERLNKMFPPAISGEERFKISDLSPIKLREDSHVKYEVDGCPLTPEGWSKALADSLDAKMLKDSLSTPPSLVPGAGLIGPARRGRISSTPLPMDGKINESDLVDKCLETVLICMPHGYGFMPVLPNTDPHKIELSFGKLGWDKRVRVLMIGSAKGELRFAIVDGKTYNHDEIRLLAMAIVETIKERNGIDDSEQDDKGSD